MAACLKGGAGTWRPGEIPKMIVMIHLKRDQVGSHVILLPVSSIFSSCLIATSTFWHWTTCSLMFCLCVRQVRALVDGLLKINASSRRAFVLVLDVHYTGHTVARCPSLPVISSHACHARLRFTHVECTHHPWFSSCSAECYKARQLVICFEALRLPAWPDNHFFAKQTMSRSSVMTSSLHSHTHTHIYIYIYTYTVDIVGACQEMLYYLGICEKLIVLYRTREWCTPFRWSYLDVG